MYTDSGHRNSRAVVRSQQADQFSRVGQVRYSSSDTLNDVRIAVECAARVRTSLPTAEADRGSTAAFPLHIDHHMSLFSLKEWWRVRQGDGLEEFDQTAMCIGNVDNSPRARTKIVTGSFSGMLRIYQPSSSEFMPSDLLLESQLAEPILGVAIGQFLSGTPNSLAILHPRCLELYQVTRPRTAADDEVPFLEVQQQWKHPIPHTAANFCYGRFRGASATDHILVQAYDGQVYIFEHGSLIQTTFFEDFLVPGPIVFAPDTDSIITCSSAFELQSYSYLSLVQASITKSEATAAHGGHAMNKQKTPSPQWKLLFGELASDIQITGSDMQDGMSDIVVVGERTVAVCSQYGELKFQRRLDYHPAAVTSYKYVLAVTI